jgi:hypothetical protein
VRRLDGTCTPTRGSSPFLDSYVRRDAVLFSQIEGTRLDLLLFELGTNVADFVPAL